MNTRTRLQPGDAAPSPQVQGPDGTVQLAGLWSDTPVVLTFLRHFG